MGTQVMETNNYAKFVLSPFNRDVVQTKRLEKSFLRHGWLDAYPIDVERLPDGKLMIKAGHHRFLAAVNLKIPIKYVECEND